MFALRRDSTSSNYLLLAKIVLWGTVLAAALFPPTLFAQDLRQQAWLPSSVEEGLQASLQAVVNDSLGREGCHQVLEAKVNDRISDDGLRFIVTCSNNRGTTLNLVYSQQDIANGFTDYGVPQKPKNIALDNAAARAQAQAALFDRHGELIGQCETQLRQRLSAQRGGDERSLLELLSQQQIEIDERDQDFPTVFIHYRLAAMESANNSAVCKRSRLGKLNLAIFSAN